MQLCNVKDYVQLHDEYFIIRSIRKYIPIAREDEFLDCICDLLEDEHVCQTKKYIQHGSTTCYQHQLSVAYYTYKICKLLGLNKEEATRGAMLHDFFLYDWHNLKSKERRKHTFNHPKVALVNAKKYFKLTSIEEDIIVNHMWPLSSKFPKYLETYVVTIADKFCCVLEVINDYLKK